MTVPLEQSLLPAGAEGVEALAALLRGRRLVVLTGAGCSTESGIPDYRGPGTLARARNPIQHREFLTRPEVRTRYWARSLLGWPRFSAARPNAAHQTLAALERDGHLLGLITQNVDRLHQAAGSQRVIELHGALARVRCLDCEAVESRVEVQERLLALNPGFAERTAEPRPDGDAELPAEAVRAFQVAGCTRCGGTLKPDVVFFGDNVPPPTVEAAFALLEEGDALLVVGSSLAVYSGFRFLQRAADRHMPIGLVNLGECRGGELVDVRVEARAGEVLPRLAEALARGRSAPGSPVSRNPADPRPALIRPAAPEDLPALAAALAPLPLFKAYGLEAPALAARFRGALERGEGLLLALDESGPVGVCWFLSRGTFGTGAYLRTLAIREDRHGSGLGARLLAAYEAGCGAPSGGYFLLTSGFNEGAQRFYQRHGYRQVGQLPGFAVPGVTELVFWKPLVRG